MRRICTSGDLYFINEGKTVLVEEFGRNYTTYFSILEMIAQGEVTQKQIGSAVGVANISGQLKLLEEDYKIIRKKMQKQVFRGKTITKGCLCMDDMDKQF